MMAIAGVEGLAHLEKHPDFISNLKRNIAIIRSSLADVKGIKLLSHDHASVSSIIHIWLANDSDRYQSESILQRIVDEVLLELCFYHSCKHQLTKRKRLRSGAFCLSGRDILKAASNFLRGRVSDFLSHQP